jgi:hypothetical protein
MGRSSAAAYRIWTSISVNFSITGSGACSPRFALRLRFPRTNLRRAILLRFHSRRDNDTEQTMVQQTTPATLLQ